MRSLVGSVVALATPKTAGQNPPVPYASDRTNLGIFQRGSEGIPATAQLDAVLGSSTLYAVVRTLYESVGALKWHLYRTPASGAEEDRIEVTKHAALDLINKPNTHMTRTMLFEQSQQWIDLTGESYWVIERLLGMPIALWPVRPDRMAPVKSADRFLLGWLYSTPDGEKIPLDVNEVIQFKLPHPKDPYRGLGPVQALLYSIDNVKFGLQWNRQFFANSAAPYGVITLPGNMGDTEWKRFVSRWREGHQGASNAGRVGVLEAGATYTEAGSTQKDMQFTELIGLSRDMIHEAFSFPRSMTGQSADVNRANAETGEEVYGRWLVDPRGARFRDSMTHILLPMFGAGDLEFDFDSAVPKSEEQENVSLTARANAASVLVAAGFDAADVLETCGLPEMGYEKPAPTIVAPPSSEPGSGDGHGDGQSKESTPNEPNPENRAPIRVKAWAAFEALEAATPQQPHETVDLTQAQEEWAAALLGLMAFWPSMLTAWSADLVLQVRKIVESGKLGGLGALTVDSTEAAALIRHALIQMAGVAAARVVQEAARQGRTIRPAAASDSVLTDIATATAELLAGDVARSAGAQALLVAGPNATPGSVGDAVASHLSSLSDANARQALGGALTGAQNHGRFETFAAIPAPEPALYASEKMDTNTCGPCREVDGRWLGNSSDMAQVYLTYPVKGYVGCLGRDRCRGTVVGVYRPEQVDGHE